MANIDQMIRELNLNHKELSNRAGNSNNWFNDAYNNNEDIYISSFAKVLSIIGEEDKKQRKLNFQDYKLTYVFDKKILKIASLISGLSEEHNGYLEKFILEEKEIFLDVLGDWKTMGAKNKLTQTERTVIDQIGDLINKEGGSK